VNYLMQEPEQSGVESASEKDRRNGNIVLLLFLVILIGGGIWLINAMIEQRAIDNCLAQGRRNCAPVEVPAR
jgi:cytoskeletal protein RodZ